MAGPYVPLESILSAPQLTGAYEEVKTGIFDPFPADFYDVSAEVEGNTASYFRFVGQRRNAPITAYGGPARHTQMKGISEVPVVLAHSNNEIMFPMHKFANMIRMDSRGANLEIDVKGVDYITKQVRYAVQKVKNLKITMLISALSLGAIYWDKDGAVLPSSSGSLASASYSIPANNQNQLNGIIGTKWSDSTAEIIDQLTGLDQYAAQNNGYIPKIAFYGRNIPKYFSGNRKLAAFLARDTVTNQQYIKAGRIEELGNIMWVPAYRSFFEDGTGTVQKMWNDDLVTFVPGMEDEWLSWINGAHFIPNDINVVSDGAAALANVSKVYGDFMYAAVNMANGVAGVQLFYGTTTLPVIHVPGAVYQATVNF